MEIKYFNFINVTLALLMLSIAGYSQSTVAKAGFMNKSANLFMGKVPSGIYSITKRVEPDGSFKINEGQELSEEEILNVLGISSEFTFELKRENNSYIDSKTNISIISNIIRTSK